MRGSLRFPPECREVSHVATDGEIHRADIKTPTGIVIEVQHSSMTDAERISREKFYGNLVWIVDGSGFRNNFDIFHMLPDPNSELAKDLVWSKGSRKMRGAARGQFWRLSEESHGSTKVKVVRCHSIREIEDDVKLAYRGHHQYGWIRPRKIWLNASCPVYIDFGDNNLLRLEVYDDTNLPCICYVSKSKFVHDAMHEISAKMIGASFEPSIELAFDNRLSGSGPDKFNSFF
jgi:competence protein CoiA